jgi:hypothetical protein
MLNNLYMKVMRTGPVFTGEARVSPDGEGYGISLQLAPGAFNQNEVGELVKKTLGSYIRTYLQETGWRVKSASFKKGRLELLTAPRSSGPSRKR